MAMGAFGLIARIPSFGDTGWLLLMLSLPAIVLGFVERHPRGPSDLIACGPSLFAAIVSAARKGCQPVDQVTPSSPSSVHMTARTAAEVARVASSFVT